MAVQRGSAVASGDFREAVCIDGSRVYDSCCDRDCLEDLRVYFSPAGQELIEQAVNVRCRGSEVINVFIDVEPVHLNRGFYSCDLTFYFAVKYDVYTAINTLPTTIEGITAFQKKVILYGSEGKVRTFSNLPDGDIGGGCQTTPLNNLPRCVVECVDPVTLGSRICELRGNYDVCLIPSCVTDRIGGEIATDLPAGSKIALVTLGLFTIVQLIRNVQMLIPVYDFCIPEKECDATTDNPCEVFGRLRFPTEDFFPPRECEIGESVE